MSYMEFKGTPGKWKVWRNQIDDTPIIGTVNGTSLFIVSKSSETSIYHYEANALLISKAPEMLQMLNKILEENMTDYSCCMNIKNDIEKLIKEATDR